MFQSARITLTLWYASIIMLISIFFSLALFRLATLEIDRIEKVHAQRMLRWIELGNLPLPEDRQFRRLLPFQDPEILRETKNRIASQLIFLNVAISALAAAASFALAGRTLKPIHEMVEQQKTFISDASHELKTPITALKTSLEVYKRNPKKSLTDADILISNCLNEIDTITNLIEHLLAQASLDANYSNIQKTAVLLSSLVEKSITLMQPIILAKQIRIVTDLKNITVSGVPSMLERLCIILLDNALKYSPDQSTIYISLRKKNKKIELVVQDEGIGIETQHLPHIFERFYRAGQSRTATNNKGYGLGLSIAKKIADHHDANIEVVSSPGHGSTFSVIFEKHEQSFLTPHGSSRNKRIVPFQNNS